MATKRIAYESVVKTLEDVLVSRRCPSGKARAVAREVARNSLEGTYSHGVNRFPRLVGSIDKGMVDVFADPVRKRAFGGLENYDGKLGFGITNALFGMGRAVELAADHGIGCVAMGNTNHWLRAATYGYLACEAGMVGICFTNTMPNMPAWGAQDSRLGNNPIVLGFPRKEGPILVDMAMSQYSYGSLEVAAQEGRNMPFPVGFDSSGHLTDEPAAVIASRRTMPTGYWKGAALSFTLDVIAGALSMGKTSFEISKLGGQEYSLSQVFIAIDILKIADEDEVERLASDSIAYLLGSVPDGSGTRIAYPGQRMVATREKNLEEGIPIDEGVWSKILGLLG